MFRKFLFSVCFLLITIGIATADTKVEFEGRYWMTDLTAKAKVSENNIIGTDIDLKSDLGLKDKNFPDGYFTWYMGSKSKVRFAYTQINYSGDKNVERQIEFSGATYTAGARVITDLDMKYLRFGWSWQFINVDDGKVKLGTLLEVKGFWVDTSLESPNMSPPVKESGKFAIGLPTIGVALDINTNKMVNIFAEISGLPAGKYGYFLDGEVGIKTTKMIPIENLSVVGGYRIFDIKAKNDSDFARLKISGPFIGTTLRF